MIDITKPTDQLVQDVMQGMRKQVNFLQLQPRETLHVIKQAMKFKAIFEQDENNKKELLSMAQLVQEQILYRQNEQKQRKEAITYHQNFRQGAKDISLIQTILMLLTTLTVGFISYYNNNKTQNWPTFTIGVCIITFLMLFTGIVIYNCCCHKRIQIKIIFELQEQAQTLLNTPQRKK